jgi:queuine tRNA-ribosyltransferase
MSFRFELLSTDGKGRRGRLITAHGEVPTPAFMPVGTLGAAKGVPPQQLEEAGAAILLANLYHLALRPGVELIAEQGGLHAFCGWRRPLLTDSGGFQVFSLAALRRVDDEGVSFRSHIDGDRVRFTPDGVVRAQRRLGVDIAMMLDECPPYPETKEAVADALRRTLGWARRAREAWPGGPGGLFGILQGGVHLDLREQAVGEMVGLDFDGYAVGGVSVGEPTDDRRRVVERTVPMLPAAKPRYLMGVGTPDDILHAVRQGIDLFDCVLPTRNARHGVLFTRRGVLRIKNARYRRDERPVDSGCACQLCRRMSRAFLHHLMRAGEMTGAVLATLHNLRFYLDFMAQLREAIASGRLTAQEVEAAARSRDQEPSEGSYLSSESPGFRSPA